MKKYNHKEIEKKWQAVWEKEKRYRADNSSKKPKYYALIEFPYPSGDGLHVGHIRSYTAMDIVARKRRMEGYDVLYPIGWDAFGLPTENYAIKTKKHPREVTKDNTDTFRKQLKSLGFSFDWDREVNTTDPKYYKWTQWMFLRFFKHGLAYKANVLINWCPSCKIGLANEEVITHSTGSGQVGKCERCGTDVERRNKEQWLIKITKYADKLLEGLNKVDYIHQAKIQQENWIGRSEGAEIDFLIRDSETKITVFTTRPDTLFGVTYMVLAPGHSLVKNLESRIQNLDEVKKYVSESQRKTDIERTIETQEKTGVELKGVKVINPATREEIPVFIADYVFVGYGTGAIMAVPAHDERDLQFAKKYNLPIRKVIEPPSLQNLPRNAEDVAAGANSEIRIVHECYAGEGTLVNSGKFDRISSKEVRKKITKFVNGKEKIQYKLRDWVFSRQRYWGEPIPLVKCEKCNWVPIPDDQLPVELPDVENYEPTATGESPLAAIESWVNTTCPKCGGPAKRETDVMPNWAGSSWYFLRYTDPDNDKDFASAKNLKHWMPVDWYNGGMEHTVLHLLYSRFWNMFLHDIGVVPTSEPYKKRTSHGMVLGEGGVKMSKSLGNVITPDELIKEFGADSLRLYEMFIGPFNQSVAWNPRGILGPERFLRRVWDIGANKISEGNDKKLEKHLHQTIKKISADIENMSFNTAVSTLMIFINACYEKKSVSEEIWKAFLIILAPFAPHITEELWQLLGEKNSIQMQKWPEFDPKLIEEETFELVIQVNGKVRATMKAEKGMGESDARAISSPEIEKWLEDKEIKKVIFVPDRLINFIV